MASHHVTIGPVRLTEHDVTIGCRRARGIGYSWSCRCGARGRVVETWRAARAEGLEHQAAQLEPEH